MRGRRNIRFKLGALLFGGGLLGAIALIIAGIAKGPWEYWTGDSVYTGWYGALLGNGAAGAFWFFAVLAAIGFAVMLWQAFSPDNHEKRRHARENDDLAKQLGM